ncbi:YbaB/EbfC family nucleoid-associated protein [Flectobacillus roseus]|jgi:DNA-binding YbaB/EbfC family protein|uniref:YbaB/EbfC family nucleoid-associated protein n=1 Tax=Flectobacillus roseus TaxID=502259 RepID=UPI0014123B66|nr:YbaB/EbfC family nucleoid-associated protein [Flectobacillus roseus]MDI9868156.1 YbaB/EbfC family nucleoid-associated protein [Flectobacillus roseus]NBA77143.1 YbaB/EbfC family nucleoid-associated protein [Emticicia sp. ODNR4P]
MFDMMGMLGKVKDLQAKMKEAQETLGTIVETGEAGGGMVKVTINGKKQLLNVEIDEDLLKPSDREVVQDLIVAATNIAMSNIEGKIKEHLQQATNGLLPNIPGLDLGGMFS